MADALSVLAPIKDSLLAKDYARQIASLARADENDVLGQLANLKPPRIFDAEETAGGHAAHDAPAAPVRRKLPQSEMNRRRFERQLLALCAARTDLALAHADAARLGAVARPGMRCRVRQHARHPDRRPRRLAGGHRGRGEHGRTRVQPAS